MTQIFTRYNNVLTEEEFLKCGLSLIGGWSWGAASSRNTSDQYTFWSKNLDDNEFFSKIMFNKILELTGDNLILHRVYANGQTYGLPGKFHTDAPDDSAMTFLFYANHKWLPDWGGDTVIADNNFNTHHAAIIPNSAIYFRGNMWHCGSEPTRFCRDLRTTIAFKLIRQ